MADLMRVLTRYPPTEQQSRRAVTHAADAAAALANFARLTSTEEGAAAYARHREAAGDHVRDLCGGLPCGAFSPVCTADCCAACALLRALCVSVLLPCSGFVLLSCSNSPSWPVSAVTQTQEDVLPGSFATWNRHEHVCIRRGSQTISKAVPLEDDKPVLVSQGMHPDLRHATSTASTSATESVTLL